MTWEQAIARVLSESEGPRHYAEIAEEIAEKGYRGSNELGATPARTVTSIIGTSLREEGETSPFVRVAMGYYALRNAAKAAAPIEDSDSITTAASGIINALGMYWERNKVVWKTEPHLLGKQQQDSSTVDFGRQIGVYFLHDSQGVVYVGRAIDQTLGRRLQQHTVDRLNGRWDRFSWFGLRPVQSDGSLRDVNFASLSVDIVISTLEAVLIEGLEPRQNRKRGDDFQAIEFFAGRRPCYRAVATPSFVGRSSCSTRGNHDFELRHHREANALIARALKERDQASNLKTCGLVLCG